jgi:hypothetical protein
MNKNEYFVMSGPCGRFFARGYLNELNDDMLALLDDGYIITLWDIKNHDPDQLVDDLPYGHHPSFAFNNLDELCLGDYV